jgi:hypothetical protein
MARHVFVVVDLLELAFALVANDLADVSVIQLGHVLVPSNPCRYPYTGWSGFFSEPPHEAACYGPCQPLARMAPRYKDFIVALPASPPTSSIVPVVTADCQDG